MFGLLFRKKHEDARRILQGRMNRAYVAQVNPGNRNGSRGAICEVAWAIPYDSASGTPLVENAFPIITRDISNDGLSFIHSAPMNDEQIVVGLQGDVQASFLLCSLEHSTPFGWGFHLVGLKPQEPLEVSPNRQRVLMKRLAQFEDAQTSAVHA